MKRISETSHPKTHRYRKRLASLEQDRSTWESHWLDIADYVNPRKGKFLTSKDQQRDDGKKRRSKIINGIAGDASDVEAAGLMGGFTSPSRPWFRAALQNKEQMTYGPVRDWLRDVRDILLDIFSRSNFYGSIHSQYEELADFGTGCMLIEKDYSTVIRCRPFTVGEYFLSAGNDGRIDTLYRRISMTARQMVAEFGEEAVSESVRTVLDNEDDTTTFKVIHCVQPRKIRNASLIDSTNMEFESVYFEENGGNDTFLREGGYQGIPFMAPRWFVTDSAYGRGPGMKALSDCKQLQKMEEKKLKALDKMVDPPMNAPLAMRKQGGTIIAGGVNYVDIHQGQQGFTPVYQINPNVQNIAFEIDRVERRIQKAFNNDLFLSIIAEEKTMTAREVAERSTEKLIMLGPVLERLQAEMLNVAIDRTFQIASEFGLIPPAPKEIEGQPIKIEYISLLAQAQKMMGLSNIEGFLTFVTSAAQTNDEVLDKVDFDAAVDEYGDGIGAPPKIIRSNEEAGEIRAERAQARQQQAAMEQAQQQAQTAQVLSQTDVSEGSQTALTALLGGITNGAA